MGRRSATEPVRTARTAVASWPQRGQSDTLIVRLQGGQNREPGAVTVGCPVVSLPGTQPGAASGRGTGGPTRCPAAVRVATADARGQRCFWYIREPRWVTVRRASGVQVLAGRRVTA